MGANIAVNFYPLLASGFVVPEFAYRFLRIVMQVNCPMPFFDTCRRIQGRVDYPTPAVAELALIALTTIWTVDQ
jgi:hypothetical protein